MNLQFKTAAAVFVGVGIGIAAMHVTDQFKTGQWLSNQNQPLLWLVKGLKWVGKLPLMKVGFFCV